MYVCGGRGAWQAHGLWKAHLCSIAARKDLRSQMAYVGHLHTLGWLSFYADGFKVQNLQWY